MSMLILLFFLITNTFSAEDEIEEVHIKTSHPLVDLRFHHFTKGEIIYVYGSSTSGKSTFVKSFSEILPDWRVVSTRDLKTLYCIKKMEQVCKKETRLLSQYFSKEEILLIVENPKEIFLPEKRIMPINEITEIIHSIKEVQSKRDYIFSICHPIEAMHFVFSHTFNLSKMGFKVIVDNLDVEDFFRYMLLHRIHSPLFLILTYCPSDHLLKRVIQRNEKALIEDKGNIRSCMRPFETFLHIYGLSKKNTFIDSISQEALLEVFQNAHTLAQEQIELRNQLSEMAWPTLREHIKKCFEDREQILLVSKHPYDILLNSYNMSPIEMVMKIIRIKNID